MWFRFVAATSLLVVLMACDPVYRTSVNVRSPSAASAAEQAADQPVEGAVVSLHCGARSSLAATKTDAEGAAVLSGIGGPAPEDCWLIVAKPGYELQRVQWADTCTSRVCETPVEVVLVPER